MTVKPSKTLKTWSTALITASISCLWICPFALAERLPTGHGLYFFGAGKSASSSYKFSSDQMEDLIRFRLEGGMKAVNWFTNRPLDIDLKIARFSSSNSTRTSASLSLIDKRFRAGSFYILPSLAGEYFHETIDDAFSATSATERTEADSGIKEKATNSGLRPVVDIESGVTIAVAHRWAVYSSLALTVYPTAEPKTDRYQLARRVSAQIGVSNYF